MDEDTKLGLRIYGGTVCLIGYDGACAEYNERGFYTHRRNLSPELLKKFLETYEYEKLKHEPIPKR